MFHIVTSGPIKDPEVSFIDYAIVDISSDSVAVEMKLNANNPNKFGLRNVAVDYELLYEKKSIVAGDNLPITLKPAGDTEILVPVRLRYRDMLSAVGLATAKFFSGANSIDFMVNFRIHGKPTVYDEQSSQDWFTFERKIEKKITLLLRPAMSKANK